MDPLSQAVFGATAAQVSARHKYYAAAIVAGSLGGMAADLDILIQSSAEPTMGLFFHRHFTHSLPFVPVGGLIVALGLWLLLKVLHAKFPERGARKPKFKPLWLFSTLGYATHGLVDTMTSYGTVLLWPFTETRFALDWVSIIDPVITLPLMFGVWLSFKSHTPNPLIWCCAFVFAYIGFLATWHTRTEAFFNAHLADNGIKVDHVRVMPLLFKPLKYRAVYLTETHIGISNIVTHLNGTTLIKPAGKVKRFDVDAYAEKNPELGKVIRKYNWFADGFTGVYAQYPLILADYRYGRYTTPLQPLWGLNIDEEKNRAEPIGLR